LREIRILLWERKPKKREQKVKIRSVPALPFLSFFLSEEWEVAGGMGEVKVKGKGVAEVAEPQKRTREYLIEIPKFEF
jgi:hypothetical protein